MKRATKKLRLNKQTIRRLSQENLMQVHGGTTSFVTCSTDPGLCVDVISDEPLGIE